jgi:hypothetical protein
VFTLKIAKKSKNGQIELVNSSIDAELNGEHFIPAHQHSLSGDFYEIIDFKVDRKVEYGYAGRGAQEPARPERQSEGGSRPPESTRLLSVSCRPVTEASEGGPPTSLRRTLSVS